MIRPVSPVLGRGFLRPTLAVALALGALGVVATPAMAKPQAEAASPGFVKVGAPFQKAVDDAKKRPNVIAAKGKPAELATALAAEKAQVPQVIAAASTPTDRLFAGQLVVSLGQTAEDPALLKQGLTLMIESGKATNAGQLQFFLGQSDYQLKDYAGAQAAWQAAVAAGYRENDIDALLAQSYFSGGQQAQGLQVLRRAMEAKLAAGQVPPENWYHVGLSAAYKGKLTDQSAYLSTALVQRYPSTANWGLALSALRDTARYGAQESLDLMRLMGRTNSYTQANDYVEYIQTADPRRYPGEVLDVINAGAASGKLPASHSFVVEAKQIATTAANTDRAALPSIERDARASSASATVVTAAGDTFLSYKNPAKAAELYTIALTKPGADQARVLTRLGIAQVDKGDYAAAQATFAKVDGPRKPLAQLWSIYAAQKAAGK